MLTNQQRDQGLIDSEDIVFVGHHPLENVPNRSLRNPRGTGRGLLIKNITHKG
jgi:hypothetical protein